MEYSELQKHWLARVDRHGPNLCIGGGGAEGDGDLGFSWSPCECCGCQLGGDRFKAVILQPKEGGGFDADIELEVCQDCLMYIANGDVPEDENIDWLHFGKPIAR